ncbi:phospholipase [bacterium]|nr:MAG: phospholipase [bacterium]
MQFGGKQMRSKLILIITFLFQAVCTSAQWKDLYQKEWFISGNDTLPIRVLYPPDFNESKSYSLMIFLHGRGESGKENEKQLIHGAWYFAQDSIRNKSNTIVIFPQCPTDDYWGKVIRKEVPGGLDFTFMPNEEPTKSMSLVMNLLDNWKMKPFINSSKIYLGGISMGGIGTYDLLYRRPNDFAAALVVCGGGSSDYVSNYAKYVPIWIFHGEKDGVVKPELTLRMMDKILESGGSVKATLYPNVGHNAWDYAFLEPDLSNWLFTKIRRE